MLDTSLGDYLRYSLDLAIPKFPNHHPEVPKSKEWRLRAVFNAPSVRVLRLPLHYVQGSLRMTHLFIDMGFIDIVRNRLFVRQDDFLCHEL